MSRYIVTYRARFGVGTAGFADYDSALAFAATVRCISVFKFNGSGYDKIL